MAASRSDRGVPTSLPVAVAQDPSQVISSDEAAGTERVSGPDSRSGPEGGPSPLSGAGRVSHERATDAGPLVNEQQTFEQLLEYVRRLIKKYQALEGENQALRRRLEDLQRRAEAAEQENQRLRARLETLEAERDAIRLQVAELVRELENLELE